MPSNSKDLDEILEKYKDYIVELNEIPEFIYQSERHLTKLEAITKINALIQKEVIEAKIETGERFIYRGWCLPEMEVMAEDYIKKLKALNQANKENK